MNSMDKDKINNALDSFRDTQQDLSTQLSQLLNIIDELENKYDEEYNLSHLLSNMRAAIESVDADSFFSFIDEVETELETVSYNYKKAEKANNISVYKVVNQQMPMYYQPKY